MLTILGIYISFILFLVFILLFGPSPRFRFGIVGKLHVFITDTMWTHLGKVMSKVMGERTLTKCHGCWSYLSEQRNPSLQILYLFFISGSIGTFLVCGYDLLPATSLSPIHQNFIIPVMIVFTYACFFVASSVGPGEVNAQNVRSALDAYPYDYLLFDPKICGTCKIQNAVQVCWYGSFLVYHIFVSRMYHSSMFKYLVATKRWEQLGLLRDYHIFIYQMQEDKSLGALGVFASLAGLVIFIFFIYNIYLIATGVTTNESFKWEDIGEMIYRRELVEVQDISPEGRPVGPKKYEQRDRRHPSHPRYIPPAQPSPAPAPKQDTGYTTQEHVITKMREIDNIYDMGVKANISSILFPPLLTVSDKGRSAVQQSQQPSQEKAKSKKSKKA
ncbi:palmitoyltransferase swf1 [Podila epicladia]|nr:palmitoyltransferase swf1 [Podila epicladia]